MYNNTKKLYNLLGIFALLIILIPKANADDSQYRANSSVEECQVWINGTVHLTELFEKNLPEIPKEKIDHLKELSKKQDNFTLREEPYFLTWQLKSRLARVKNSFEHLISNPDAPLRRKLAYAGELVLLTSNVRNSWTEFEAYSDEYKEEDWRRGDFNKHSLAFSGALFSYIACLSQFVD